MPGVQPVMLTLPAQMPTDPPPSPTLPPRPSPHRVHTTHSGTSPRTGLSPAQAIAAAWHRETAEAQHQWRMADVRAKEQYLSPVRWDTGYRSQKKRIGAKM